MCEFSGRIKGLVPNMAGRGINEIFSANVQARFPYGSVRVGHCLVCGAQLSDIERRPPGRATRSMCETCYGDLIVARVNEYCVVCGGRLPQYKVQAQIKNPRELRENIHEGECLDYFTLCHCKGIMGVDLSFLRDEHSNYIGIPQQNTYALPSPSLNTEIKEAAAKLEKEIEKSIRLLKGNLSSLFPNQRLALPNVTQKIQLPGSIKRVRRLEPERLKELEDTGKVTVIRYPKYKR